MVITHNIAAMNAQRNFNLNTNKLQKNLEKLSSGYKINRAADDAAGLSISESMRMILSGTAQAQKNVQDGIGLIQTAEGAMEEIHSMLNRAYELSANAANGTYSYTDRLAMESELDELISEIERITNETDFNGIDLLKGIKKPSDKDDVFIDVTTGLPSWVGLGQAANDSKLTETFITQEEYIDINGNTNYVAIKHSAASLDFSNGFDKDSLIGKGFYSTCCTCNNHYSICFTNSATSEVRQSGNHYIYNIGIANVTNADELVQAIIDGTNNGNPNNHYTMLVADPTNSGKLIVYDDRSSESSPANTLPDFDKWSPNWKNPSFNTYPSGSYGKFGMGIAVSADEVADNSWEVQLQIGATPQEVLKILLPDSSLDALKIENISVLSQQSALDSMEIIKESIKYLSSERGRMGAYQNTLEHRGKYLGVMHENLQTAESRIRDVDMAEEMMQYVKNDILNQSSMLMVSHTKTNPQSILKLIS